MTTGPLTLDDIVDQRAYERERHEFRSRVIAAKKLRRISVGPVITLTFESRLTMRFQVQEMARAEKMITDEQIQHELDVYNRLLPAPGELSATLFLSSPREQELRTWLPDWWASSGPASCASGTATPPRSSPPPPRRSHRPT